ncbi:hypothetical protein ABZ642_46215 [Streptomyces sp. NPDC007157]|uniref:hypothetical protein n=1 Tax=Streptomyces sp. NPDC007157 TaxID=3154681 RepID=UPI0033D720A6
MSAAQHPAPAARRRRLLAAAALALVTATALSGCRDGEGVRDEGPSAASRSHPADDAVRQASPPSGNS